MGKYFTIALNGPIVGTALPTDYPVTFSGDLSIAAVYLNRSASFVFKSQLRCSSSLRTAMLRHRGGHVSQYPDSFVFDNAPVNYRVYYNAAHKAAYTVFINQQRLHD